MHIQAKLGQDLETETEKQTPNSSVKGSGANPYPRDISKTPSTPSPLDPRPSIHDARPSTLIFFFWIRLIIKFGEQYQVYVAMLAHRLRRWPNIG